MGLDVCLKMPHRHFRCFAGNMIATQEHAGEFVEP
jgi:hypothetical protein